MFGIVLAHVLYAKVVDNEAVGDVAVFVLPEAWGWWGRKVAVGGKVSFEVEVSNEAGLFESIYAFTNLHVDPYIGSGNILELVLEDDFFGDDTDGEAHVLVVIHGSVQVEVLDVYSHELCVDCGYGAVDEALVSGELGSWSADGTGVVETIATDSESSAIWFRFLGTDGGGNATIHYFAIGWDLVCHDEPDCFGAG